MPLTIRRRELIAVVGGAATAWPRWAQAQQPRPVIGFINAASPGASSDDAAAFGEGLKETGYYDGQNVAIEPHWLDGRYDRLPALLSELVRRQVSVIATPGSTVAGLAAKAATTTIPIVFGVAEDPVQLGLVASLARPGGNATGVNFLLNEAVPKRLGLLHDLVPAAVRLTVMVNPGNVASAEATLREVRKAAGTIGLQFQVINASTSQDIDAAFAMMSREHAEALFVAPDGFFTSRRVQFAIWAARTGIAAAYSNRKTVEVGGLMSSGTNIAHMYHQVGVYVGRILSGDKPAELPVVQSTKFDFAINLQTAKALGREVPPGLLVAADEVIE